jgi:hypothetical protein
MEYSGGYDTSHPQAFLSMALRWPWIDETGISQGLLKS